MNDIDLSQLEQVLGSMSADDFKDILSSADPVSWVENNRILKGAPFSFKDRDYLLQPYRDEYQDIIFYKGRQVEMSEFSMNWLLRKLNAHPYTAGLHAFPRNTQALKFSKQRLEAAIKDSDLLAEWYKERESELMMRKFVKATGERLNPYNFYILGATWESRKDTIGDAARSVSLDFIVYDERQDHPNDVETVLGEGASHSEFNQTLTLGTPKLPGTQFDQQWESSDKHHWYVICPKCGTKQVLNMDNVMEHPSDDVGWYYGCIHCKSELDKRIGMWQPDNPQKRPMYRGYHINQLMTPWIKPRDIMKKYLSPTYPRRRFYNEVLGYAYGGDDIPITLQMMHACGMNNNKIGDVDDSLYGGVDWGATSYAWLQTNCGTGHKVIDVLVVADSDPREHPKKIARWMKKYAPLVKRVVCDAGPDITRFYNLKDELRELGVTRDVWACYYSSPPAKTAINWNEKEQNVTIGRSEGIERIIDEVSDKALILPGADLGLEKMEMAMDHFTNISAIRAKTQSGMEYIIYEDTGPDHFLHAKLYADVASSTGTSISIGGASTAFNSAREVGASVQNGRLGYNKSRESNSKKFPKFGNRRRRR